jgi:hypothetical protein
MADTKIAKTICEIPIQVDWLSKNLRLTARVVEEVAD